MSELPAESHVESHDEAVNDEALNSGAVNDGSADSVPDADRREALLADTPEEIEARAPGTVETGNPAVDEVIVSLQSLDSVPVDEHVAVFEQAHEQLRRTLSGAGDDQA